MRDQPKRIKKDILGKSVWQSILCLLGHAVIPFFWLAACQPATVPSMGPDRLSEPYIQMTQKSVRQNSKRSDPINVTDVNFDSVSLIPPRSIILIEESEPTQNFGQDQLLEDTEVSQPKDQNAGDQEKAAEIATATAIMDSITWQYQAGEKATKTLGPIVPDSQDLSLGEDALEAAFTLLSNRANPDIYEPVFDMPPKPDGVVRVGLLAPLSGKHAALGIEIRRSVEMALFTINNSKIELIFLDTKGGEDAGNAAMIGIKRGVDIFIGPLFTDSVIEARAVTDDIASGLKKPPMLLLSNNVDVAAADRWLMGYLPEQQLDGLLAHAISEGKRKFALIAQDTVFGRRLLSHANRRLADFGLQPAASRVLSDEDLVDEDNLKAAIRNFTRYEPSLEGEMVGDSPFDAVLFAGDPAFALRTAPLLAYYDVGPDRALYLGNSLWNQSQLLDEPSLQGGLFSIRPSNLDLRFNANWDEIWPEPAGQLARVGFDSLALVAALAESGNKDWAKQLVSNSGFKGFSGAFRLLPNGRNIRSFELRQIENGHAKIIKPAPNKI